MLRTQYIYTNLIENNGVQYILAHDNNNCICVYINNGIWYCKELDFSIMSESYEFAVNKVGSKLYVIYTTNNSNVVCFNIA